jgi:hypothetical protein
MSYHAPVSDEQLKQAATLLAQHEGNKSAASRAANLSPSAFLNRLKLAAERGLLPTDPVMPGFRINRTAHTYDRRGELVSKTIQQKPELGPEFQIPEGQIVKGVSALTDADGRIVQQWIKTRTEDVTPHLVTALKKTFASYKGKSPKIARPKNVNADLLNVYPIADQHNGLLAWGRETGASYDLKIGADRLRESTAELMSTTANSKRALILNLGDWQHTDDQKNMTPGSGNLLDVDSRYFKILTAGVRLMQDVIELALQKHERVLVRNLPGNHDPHASVALTVALAAFYANNPRVTIDDDPSDHFFMRFGATLIGATHGHRMKPDRMAIDDGRSQSRGLGRLALSLVPVRPHSPRDGERDRRRSLRELSDARRE